MQEPNQTIFSIPEPEENMWEDLIIYEIPDWYTISEQNYGFYLLNDIESSLRATLMLPSTDFKTLNEFVKTHQNMHSNLDVEYTFDCRELEAQQNIVLVLVGLLIASFLASVARVCYLKYKNQLRNRHETLLFQIFMIILTAICALSAVFTYVYDR